MKKRTILIDTDPGIDDIFAIAYATLHPAIHIVGLTSVFGNVDVENTTKNLLYIRELAKLEVPIAMGAKRPLFKNPNFVYHIHGENGLGKAERPPISRTPEDISAPRFIVDMAHKYAGERFTIVALGPLTNIAMALALEPKLPELVDEVLLMSGAFIRGGNVTPVAEANVYSDPHAAEMVYRSELNCKAFGLDVTLKMPISMEEFQLLNTHPVWKNLFQDMIPFYMDFYSERYGKPTFICHDTFPFFYITHPESFKFAKGRIAVIYEGLSQGQTILEQTYSKNYDTFFQWRPPHYVALNFDIPTLKNTLFEIFTQ